MSDTWDPGLYGERIADVYDDWYDPAGPLPVPAPSMDVGAAVDALARLADGGAALELGIGTGRLALPLAARGVEVHGVDASPAMVERLRAKPGGADLPVAMGDMADVPVVAGAPASFSLVFVAFNTFLNLHTEGDQARCLRNVAARLAPGGRFVAELFIPDLDGYDRDQMLSVRSVDERSVMLNASRLDRDGQRIDSALVELRHGAVRFVPIRLRYVFPEQLDALAAEAGLTLERRDAGWRGEPFDESSPFQVSVYRGP